MKGYHLIYIEKGQVDEALFEINKIMVPFLDIEGYNYKIEILYTVKETARLSNA